MEERVCRYQSRAPVQSALVSALGRKRTLARLGNERPLTGTGLNPGNDWDGRKADTALMSAMGRKQTAC